MFSLRIDLILSDLSAIPEKDPCWKESEPGENPSNNKNSKDDITGSVQLGVVEHLGKLEEDIREVVYKKDQSSTPIYHVIYPIYHDIKVVFMRCYLVRLQVHEKDRRAMVVRWWMNISTKSFLRTSKNWEKESDQ